MFRPPGLKPGGFPPSNFLGESLPGGQRTELCGKCRGERDQLLEEYFSIPFWLWLEAKPRRTPLLWGEPILGHAFAKLNCVCASTRVNASPGKRKLNMCQLHRCNMGVDHTVLYMTIDHWTPAKEMICPIKREKQIHGHSRGRNMNQPPYLLAI